MRRAQAPARSIVIEGGAGIGKTALVEAAGGLARDRQMAVLAARGTELETDYPFGARASMP